ncbi:RNA polymerase sigma-70 factor [Pedobacter sp. ASV12]|uniref:RNA polymerase sigma-70 factor n=1 Tax=Pedobacter sp. ASV12 TaxID=2795120 RepID=UPI0018ED9D5C|nr:RNA polymerase sigma-70 factor [Pedobacter sp. ASV12]
MAVEQLLNEREILLQIADGSQAAFAQLFKHYHRYVFAFAKKITHSQELAGEIVQDIFLKLWLKRETLGTIENFGAYLNRTVRNTSFNVLRQLAHHAKLNLKLSLAQTELEESTNKELDYRETKRLLSDALDTLSAQQRTVYRLCHQEGLKYAEAAEKMNISPQTVHEYMKLALKKIRFHFKKNGAGYQILIAVLFKFSLLLVLAGYLFGS